MIASPPNMKPVVCLAREAFPVATTGFVDDNDSNIPLPIVAGSCESSNGRVVCFAQLRLLLDCRAIADTGKLIQNAIQWISKSSDTATILVLGFDNATQQLVASSLKDIGFAVVEEGHEYRAIVVPSDIDLSNTERFNKIVDDVENKGVGLAVFYRHSDCETFSMLINKLLVKFGLSFTYCFLNQKYELSENIQVPTSYTYVSDLNFFSLIERFKTIIKQPPDVKTLDDIVVKLRCHICVCDERHSEQLEDICQYTWEFLKRTNYHTDEGICPDITHKLAALLLMDLYEKIPQDQVKPIPEHETFPGKTGEVELGDFHLTIQPQKHTKISTGLWLPAGIVALVECEDVIPNIYVQIGSHEQLFYKSGPLKRWPSMTSNYPLSEKVTSVVTALGGIVYVCVSNMPEQEPIEITFRGFCQHPLYDILNPEIWEQTKDIQVPWGELITEHAIFTLPSDELRRISDFYKVNETFNAIVTGISNFMSINIAPYRLVFDEDLPEDYLFWDYPIFLSIDDIPGILDSFDKPSKQLFCAVSKMAIGSIREEVFDVIIENMIARIATSVIFQELFSEFIPFENFLHDESFTRCWAIHNIFDFTLIQHALEKFQNPSFIFNEIPEDNFLDFYRELCIIGKKELFGLFELRPIPLGLCI